MDRVLCVILCVVVMVVSVRIIAYCDKSRMEVIDEPTAVTTVAEIEEETTEAIAEEPTVEATAATEPPYSQEELEMMALVIYQEAGGDACSDETRLMVGTVVMNRVADKRFPNSLYGVLTQRAQYGRLHWTGLTWPARANNPSEAKAVARAYRCAERILLGERVLPEDVIWQAEFIQGTEVVAYQDGMYFCR